MQQGCDTKHSSKSTTELQKKKRYSVVQSPDLNLTERLGWGPKRVQHTPSEAKQSTHHHVVAGRSFSYTPFIIHEIRVQSS